MNKKVSIEKFVQDIRRKTRRGNVLLSGWFHLSTLISVRSGCSIDSRKSIKSALVGNFYHIFIIVHLQRTC
jgi:hypothetical protein